MKVGTFVRNDISDVSSDIHAECISWRGDDGMCVSRYEIALPGGDDLCIEERRGKTRRRSCHLIMHHLNVTSVEDVGKQLWRGALLLSDYIIHMRKSLVGKTVFELGCGIGFISKISSLLQCDRVYMTDATMALVDIANDNIRRNDHVHPIIADTSAAPVPVRGRVLNWCTSSNSRTHLDPADGWTSDDIDHLSSTHTQVVWLAADVIYDDDITEAFFQTCLQMMRPGEHMWLAIEKRFNFSIEELSVVAHGYRRFLSYVAVLTNPSLNDTDQSPVGDEASRDDTHADMAQTSVANRPHFIARRISLNFPQSVLSYDRVKDLEMWDIVRTSSESSLLQAPV